MLRSLHPHAASSSQKSRREVPARLNPDGARRNVHHPNPGGLPARFELARGTPPPKLGEGSPAVARNEQKGRRGEGPRRAADGPTRASAPLSVNVVSQPNDSGRQPRPCHRETPCALIKSQRKMRRKAEEARTCCYVELQQSSRGTRPPFGARGWLRTGAQPAVLPGPGGALFPVAGAVLLIHGTPWPILRTRLSGALPRRPSRSPPCSPNFGRWLP